MLPNLVRNLFVALLITFFTHAQSFRLEGTIYDSSNKQPLSYATVQLKATTTGTTTNNQGRFTLDLPQGSHTLIVSYIGFRSQEVRIQIPYSHRLEVSLDPLSIELPEVVINSKDEDPAYRIIRKAIRNKENNIKSVNSFEYDEYRKGIFKSAGQIASIDESFLKTFKTGDKEKEFTIASFRTENIKKNDKNINMFRKMKIDFYKDTIRIIGNKIHLPLAQDAFDYYDYKLLNVKSTDEKLIYFIGVIPRSEIRPLFTGMVLIEDSSFALVGLDLKNNKGVTIPFITDLSFRFTERKVKLDGLWFPQYLESYISMGLSLQGLLSVEKLELETFRSFSNQTTKFSEPDSLFSPQKYAFAKFGYRDTVAAGASSEGDTSKTTVKKNVFKPVMLTKAETDSLRPIPLNDKEISAYKELDSTKRPEKMIKAKGVLATYADMQGEHKDSGDSFWGKAAETFLSYINFKNTRVEGIGLGLRYDHDNDTAYTFGISGLYPFGLKKPEGSGYFGLRLGDKHAPIVTLGLFSQVERWDNITPFPELMNSLSITFGLEDIFNYYKAEGYNINIKKEWKGSHNSVDRSLMFGFTSERQSSISDIFNHRIFTSRFAKRINPAIKEGLDNRLSLNFISGTDPLKFQVYSESGFTLLTDLSLKELGGDFGYLKAYSVYQLRFNTIFDELMFPPYMLVRLEGGIVHGTYGLQQILTPENSLAFLSTFGAFKGLNPYEYVGDKLAAVHVEHNWRSVIFQSLGLRSLAEMNIGIITGASALKMWNDSDVIKTAGDIPVYWEVYGGFTGLLTVLRLEAAYTSNKIFVLRTGFNISL